MPPFAVVGLGNPGKEYENTRHNIGFLVVDELNRRYRGNFTQEYRTYFESRIRIKNRIVFLFKPITFMNLSGEAVKHIVNQYKISIHDRLLIVLDDVNLPFGTLRLRLSGSDGGQKGLRSIIQALQTEQFPRLRIGIGGEGVKDVSDYVLSEFTVKEKKDLPLIIQWAADAVESFVLQGAEVTMSRFNKNILNNIEEE